MNKRPDVKASIFELDSISAECDQRDPVEKFLADTAQSYADAGRMLSANGTPDFTRFSTLIYGRQDMIYKLQEMSVVDGAKFFLKVTDG